MTPRFVYDGDMPCNDESTATLEEGLGTNNLTSMSHTHHLRQSKRKFISSGDLQVINDPLVTDEDEENIISHLTTEDLSPVFSRLSGIPQNKCT